VSERISLFRDAREAVALDWASVRECHLTAEAVVPGLDRLERLIS
jgi:hypothetical protein